MEKEGTSSSAWPRQSYSPSPVHIQSSPIGGMAEGTPRALSPWPAAVLCQHLLSCFVGLLILETVLRGIYSPYLQKSWGSLNHLSKALLLLSLSSLSKISLSFLKECSERKPSLTIKRPYNGGRRESTSPDSESGPWSERPSCSGIGKSWVMVLASFCWWVFHAPDRRV